MLFSKFFKILFTWSYHIYQAWKIYLDTGIIGFIFASDGDSEKQQCLLTTLFHDGLAQLHLLSALDRHHQSLCPSYLLKTILMLIWLPMDLHDFKYSFSLNYYLTIIIINIINNNIYHITVRLLHYDNLSAGRFIVNF